MKKNIKQSILKEADDVINGGRQDEYGNPEDSFAIVAAFWTVYMIYKYNFGESLDSEDVAIMMSLLKHARMLGQKSKRDNARDAIGYLAILEDRIRGSHPEDEEKLASFDDIQKSFSWEKV